MVNSETEAGLSGKRESFVTAGGVEVARSARPDHYKTAISGYFDKLDTRRGAVLSSNYEFPGRYSRWDIAFVDPPVAITARGRKVTIEALNARGRILLPAFVAAVRGPDLLSLSVDDALISLEVTTPEGGFAEEDRSRQPSVFSVLRRIIAKFATPEDDKLGLWGAFGYDLAFQFDSVDFKLPRPDDQRDLVLYFPDEIVVVDHHRAAATVYSYDFVVEGRLTVGLPRDGAPQPFKEADRDPGRGDHQPGEYAASVSKAVEYFKRGDLFEVVPGQVFYEKPSSPPSAIARRLQQINPAPFGFMFNLGASEYLIGASPEMFVRRHQRQARRDLPDLGHHPARPQRHRGRGADPHSAQFQEGRSRADHVLGRRSQRQEPHLRAGIGARHRPPPDRDVLASHSYRRPHRGAAARWHGRSRCLPEPRLGGDGDRRGPSCGPCSSSRTTRRAAVPGTVEPSAPS